LRRIAPHRCGLHDDAQCSMAAGAKRGRVHAAEQIAQPDGRIVQQDRSPLELCEAQCIPRSTMTGWFVNLG
jgi:hypothetical protein